MRPVMLGTTALLLVALALIAPQVTYANPAFELPGERFGWSALAPQRSSKENYGEKYTFDAELSGPNGERGNLYLSLMITNLGSGDHKMTSKGRLTFNGVTKKWNQKLSAKNWKSKAQPLLIEAGQVTVREEGEALTLSLKNRQLNFTLSFTELAHTWQPKGGGLKLGEQVTRMQLIPLAKVQGAVHFEDQPSPVNVTGKGWGSHSASVLGPHEQNLWSSKIRAVDITLDQTLYLRTMRLTEDYGAQQLSFVILTQGDQLLFEGTGFTLAVSEAFTDKKEYDYRVPLAFSIDVPHASDPKLRLKGDFKTLKRTRRRNPIAKRSWAERLILERFVKPMEYGYDLKYSLSLQGSAQQSFSGKATYEVFHFNQK